MKRISAVRNAVALGAVALSFLASAALAGPVTLAVQGRLASPSGAPVADGGYPVGVALYDTVDAVKPFFQEKFLSIGVTGGVMALVIGADEVLLDGASLVGKVPWVGITVAGDPELPRAIFHAVPWAVSADVAMALQCSGCIDSAQLADGAVTASKVDFTYAGSVSKGGDAVGLTCDGCVDSADIAEGTVDPSRLSQSYAASASPGGAAAGLACTGCVAAEMIDAAVLQPYAKLAQLADVALTGAYQDLSGGPDLSGYATVGALAERASLAGDNALTGNNTFSGDNTFSGSNTLTKELKVHDINFDQSQARLFRFENAETEPVACTDKAVGLAYYNTKDASLYVCNGKSFVPFATALPIGSDLNPALSCKAIVDAGASTGDGAYTLDPDGKSGPAPKYLAWCDMTTDGGGWTLVANIAPNDGNSVGYNNQAFWSGDAEYGNFANHFDKDYKGGAAWQVQANHLMIQSAATGASGVVRGWRRWPMTAPRSFDSFFTTGIVGVHATDACETKAADAGDVGTTSTWDDIIRQGTCLYADVNPSNSGEGDTIRLTTISGNGTDNNISGFAACIDCGTAWQGGGKTYMGLDRAGCNKGLCAYNVVCRMSNADCVGSYCQTHYGKGSCGADWNSRFYVR